MYPLDGQRKREFHFIQVDVFTNRPLSGNPLAVFPDAQGLDPGDMQAIAREMNLSETTFILEASSSTSTSKLRIFTPAHELPFAGHSTIRDCVCAGDEGGVWHQHYFGRRHRTCSS